MKTKKILTLILAITLLLCFTACSNNKKNRGEDITFDENGNLVESAGTNLHIWGYCDGGERERMNQLITAFNEKYASYNIKAIFTPYDSTGWEQKMKATLSSSTGPDVFLASDEYYKQWATLGFMENLDPYIYSDIKTLNMEEDLNKMFEGGVGRYHYDVETTTSTSENAHYYGLPKGTGSTAIYYNKTHLKNAGIKEISVYEENIDAYTAIYDTYECFNLPKGPVCNPGLFAINAALYPEDKALSGIRCGLRKTYQDGNGLRGCRRF